MRPFIFAGAAAGLAVILTTAVVHGQEGEVGVCEPTSALSDFVFGVSPSDVLAWHGECVVISRDAGATFRTAACSLPGDEARYDAATFLPDGSAVVAVWESDSEGDRVARYLRIMPDDEVVDFDVALEGQPLTFERVGEQVGLLTDVALWYLADDHAEWTRYDWTSDPSELRAGLSPRSPTTAFWGESARIGLFSDRPPMVFSGAMDCREYLSYVREVDPERSALTVPDWFGEDLMYDHVPYFAADGSVVFDALWLSNADVRITPLGNEPMADLAVYRYASSGGAVFALSENALYALETGTLDAMPVEVSGTVHELHVLSDGSVHAVVGESRTMSAWSGDAWVPWESCVLP